MSVVFKINGKEVTPKEFEDHPPLAPAGVPGTAGTTFRPSRTISSHALACHPDQIAGVEQMCKSHGLNVHHNKHGEPQFTSFVQRDKYAKLMGAHPLQLTHSAATGERIKRKF